jgi:addiction module HigA family antidote
LLEESLNKMFMHNPPHPGEVIRDLCISPLNLTVTDAAKGLGVSRKTLSALLNGRFGNSPDMAIRLSMTFGCSAESWMIQQAQYDLWQAEQKAGNIKVKRLQHDFFIDCGTGIPTN